VSSALLFSDARVVAFDDRVARHVVQLSTKDAADILLREEGYEQFVMISPNSLRLPPGMPANANTMGVLNTIIEWI
jgi:hypothetical protein